MSMIIPRLPLTPEQMTHIVIVRAAHRTLTRFYRGELESLDSLTPQVANWLEAHGYIETLMDEDGVHYEATEKAQRAILQVA